MKQKFYKWAEEYLFFPSFFQRIISIFLLPLTFIYLLIITYKRLASKPENFGLPIISIGNLIIGGSGKTPFTIFIAKKYSNVAVILRGYGRQSEGLYVIQHHKQLIEDVNISGDEARLLANALPNATIIVSEDRKKGIQKAKSLACKIVFLDDGFSKYNIAKFDILLRPKKEPTNLFCIPSGGYREPKIMYSTAQMVLKEGIDFKRIVTFKKDNDIVSILPQKLVLLTAISKPSRLKEFLPESIIIESFPDHHDFSKEEISILLEKYNNYSFITTTKDIVKLNKFKLNNLYLMDLELEISDNVDFSLLDKYIKSYSN